LIFWRFSRILGASCNVSIFLTTTIVQGSKEQFLLYRLRVYKDPRAFAQIFHKHKPPVYRYLSTKLPSRQDAEDALSTTFLRLWNYTTTAQVDHVGSLAITIARGVVADFYRSRKKETSLDESNKEVADTTNTEEELMVRSDISLVKKILPKLKSEYQEIVILRYLEGLSTKEVAHYLEKSESAIRVGLHRALKELRALFSKEQHERERDHTIPPEPRE